jgi:hypothetical protein
MPRRVLSTLKARVNCYPILLLYSPVLASSWRVGKPRQWRPTVAIFAALCLFVALVAGSSLRPQCAGTGLPKPAAWTNATHAAPSHADRLQVQTAVEPIGPVMQGFSTGLTPTNKKTFHNTWMTRDRPTD